MNELTKYCRDIYHGVTPRALVARYLFLVFDLLVITYFVVTTFLESYDWIVYTDMAIGVLLGTSVTVRYAVSGTSHFRSCDRRSSLVHCSLLCMCSAISAW